MDSVAKYLNVNVTTVYRQFYPNAPEMLAKTYMRLRQLYFKHLTKE